MVRLHGPWCKPALGWVRLGVSKRLCPNNQAYIHRRYSFSLKPNTLVRKLILHIGSSNGVTPHLSLHKILYLVFDYI
jgi:hypothetical protein